MSKGGDDALSHALDRALLQGHVRLRPFSAGLTEPLLHL